MAGQSSEHAVTNPSTPQRLFEYSQLLCAEPRNVPGWASGQESSPSPSDETCGSGDGHWDIPTPPPQSSYTGLSTCCHISCLIYIGKDSGTPGIRLHLRYGKKSLSKAQSVSVAPYLILKQPVWVGRCSRKTHQRVTNNPSQAWGGSRVGRRDIPGDGEMQEL